MIFETQENALIAKNGGEQIRIEAWGRNALRVRTTREPAFTGKNWALTEEPEEAQAMIRTGTYTDRESGAEVPCAEITNGRISAVVNAAGVITFRKDGEIILDEYYRSYFGTNSDESRCLRYVSRTYYPHKGGDYRIVQKFESCDGEKIFGMGQYQQRCMNLKGCMLELEQRNSQVSVPFALSSRGYGFLWNNPAVGRATFGSNLTEWIAEASKELDYWVTAADTPKQILENYTQVTGRSPKMEEEYLGLWQSKLRYRTQEEVLSVARAYRDKGIPLSVIVIDFFHWPRQGDWKFDEKYWPDPKAMIDELHEMGIKVVVSVWPSVDKKSENYQEMAARGLLIRTERGGFQTYDFQGDCVEIDPTNPEKCAFVWEKCKKNYFDLGVDIFWLDNSEPDFVQYDFDQYRYYLGTALSCSNIYPQYFSRLFYENELAAGRKNPVNLLRSAWAGSQKYGNIVWSGDVPSTFAALRDQLAAGLNMGMAGIAWWTTDIGGFMTDNWQDPQFRQLLIRWYEFAAYTGFLRMHGDRGPHDIPPLDDREFGGGYLYTGHDNELWSYGEECERIMRKYLQIRLDLKPYLMSLFDEASENGSPVIRPLFYEFPEDEKSWEISDEFMLGSSYLVAPVLTADTFERSVYLPAGTWKDQRDGRTVEGGKTILAAAPLDSIPVYRRL